MNVASTGVIDAVCRTGEIRNACYMRDVIAVRVSHAGSRIYRVSYQKVKSGGMQTRAISPDQDSSLAASTRRQFSSSRYTSYFTQRANSDNVVTPLVRRPSPAMVL